MLPQKTKYLRSHSSFGMFCGSNISNNFGFSAESLADNAERVKSKNDLRRKRAEEVEDWRVLLPYRQFDRYTSILAFQFDTLLSCFGFFNVVDFYSPELIFDTLLFLLSTFILSLDHQS